MSQHIPRRTGTQRMVLAPVIRQVTRNPKTGAVIATGKTRMKVAPHPFFVALKKRKAAEAKAAADAKKAAKKGAAA